MDIITIVVLGLVALATIGFVASVLLAIIANAVNNNDDCHEL